MVVGSQLDRSNEKGTYKYIVQINRERAGRFSNQEPNNHVYGGG